MHGIEELETETADGVILKLDRLPRASAAPHRGVIVCLHAMMTDGRYFGARREGSFAGTLAAAGYDVIIADFRGHGRSVPPRAGRDDWSFDDLVELDLPAIIAAAAASAGCAPGELAIIGHSLGGLVTMAALATGRIGSPRVVVLAATAVWLLGRGGQRRRRALMAAYRGVTALFGKAPIRLLRAGTADEAATYVRQLTGWARAARWTSSRGIDYLAGLPAVTTRVLPVVGAGDWMCTPSDAAGFAARLPGAAPLRIVGRAHGDALDPDHFALFTRPELRPVWHELAERMR
ncbi:MAG: hydrolase of the alpha/beta superfamily [Deltaproteobacteria bacterium]|nr:hydrolase of the alpha/beta superfamily [Deltaproteobacteria bacterium]